MKHRLQSWPPPRPQGYPAGVIPSYHVWADDGEGLQLMKVPGIGTRLSRIVAEEAAAKLESKKRHLRVVITSIED
jgi:hypothetical protein